MIQSLFVLPGKKRMTPVLFCHLFCGDSQHVPRVSLCQRIIKFKKQSFNLQQKRLLYCEPIKGPVKKNAKTLFSVKRDISVVLALLVLAASMNAFMDDPGTKHARVASFYNYSWYNLKYCCGTNAPFMDPGTNRFCRYSATVSNSYTLLR